MYSIRSLCFRCLFVDFCCSFVVLYIIELRDSVRIAFCVIEDENMTSPYQMHFLKSWNVSEKI